MSTLLSLPNELILMIAAKLLPIHRVNLSLACRKLHNLNFHTSSSRAEWLARCDWLKTLAKVKIKGKDRAMECPGCFSKHVPTEFWEKSDPRSRSDTLDAGTIETEWMDGKLCVVFHARFDDAARRCSCHTKRNKSIVLLPLCRDCRQFLRDSVLGRQRRPAEDAVSSVEKGAV